MQWCMIMVWTVTGYPCACMHLYKEPQVSRNCKLSVIDWLAILMRRKRTAAEYMVGGDSKKVA